MTKLLLDTSSPATFAEELRPMLGYPGGALAGVFRRGGELVHTPREGEAGYVEAEEGEDNGPAQVRPLTVDQFKALVEIQFNCGKFIVTPQTKQEVWVKTLAPMDAIKSVVSGIVQLPKATPNLRPIREITHTPVLRPDGSVLDQPGYDTSTGILYLPDRGLVVPEIPEKPTRAQVEEAVAKFLVLTAEFPFGHDDHRATWCGLAFTPLLRPILRPPYPMGIMKAPNPGSGKGFLVGMIRALHGGVLRGEIPRDAEELRKAITSTLLDSTAPVVSFDNLTGIVKSSVLEALLTTDTWTDRYLGQNRQVTVPNDRLWIATGNNAQIGGDLARRVLWVVIDPKMPNPHLRTGFKIHPPTYVPEHRGELLAAMLTMARSWVLAGMPKDVRRSDDYKVWDGALRAMLSEAGVPGTFGGEETIPEELSQDDMDWADWLAALHEQFGGETFATKDVVASLAKTDPRTLDPSRLPGDLSEKWSKINAMNGRTSGFAKSLGRWFLNRSGRFVGEGWMVESVKLRAAATDWRVHCP